MNNNYANNKSIEKSDKKRLDLSYLKTYTLDDISTNEIDDGISLEIIGDEEWVWIHIADPARIASFNSLLDINAREKATSIYLVENVKSMFPIELAIDNFSLNAGIRCPALSVAARFSNDGKIIDTKLCRSWIKPKYRLTYEDGDQLIELAPPGDKDLAYISEILEKRLKYRIKNGAVIIEQPQGRMKLTDGRIDIQIIENTKSRLLIREAMILMGTIVSMYGRLKDIPLPYRTQSKSYIPSADELTLLPEGCIRNSIIRKHLSKASVSTSPGEHFSLGLSSYVQASSPIRRYSDLIAHHQLIAYLEQKTPISREVLSNILQELNAPLRQAIEITREDQSHWRAKWFQERDKMIFLGVFLRWLKKETNIALIYIDSIAMEIPSKMEKDVDPILGAEVLVNVLSVRPEINDLRLFANLKN